MKGPTKIVARTKINKMPGFFYYVKGSGVYETPMKNQGYERYGQKRKVATVHFKRNDDACLYYVTKGGDVACAPRKGRYSK